MNTIYLILLSTTFWSGNVKRDVVAVYDTMEECRLASEEVPSYLGEPICSKGHPDKNITK